MPVLDYHIDRASLQDRIELFSLESRCFKEGIAFSKKQLFYLLKSSRVEIYVMRYNGRIIADAIILKRKTRKGEIARLYSLAVNPEYRGQGFSKKLMLQCLDVLGSENIQTVYLEVESENKIAIALYESLGFCRVKVLADYYEANGNALKMKLTLT